MEEEELWKYLNKHGRLPPIANHPDVVVAPSKRKHRVKHKMIARRLSRCRCGRPMIPGANIYREKGKYGSWICEPCAIEEV